MLQDLNSDERRANARRWAKANGFHGAQGGWIYTAKYKPVCQGWSAFFSDFQRRIQADVDAGIFRITRQRRPS